MIYTVDRLEEGWAVLEDSIGELTILPLTRLPQGTREGDKLEETEEGLLPRPELKQAALSRNRLLLEKLKNKKRRQS